MAKTDHDGEVDWKLTTWEGARRETYRRWAAAPLERIIAVIEEMEEMAIAMGSLTSSHTDDAGSREKGDGGIKS